MSSTRKKKTESSSRADGEATRKRILEAAGELFAASGLAETSSKAIAARAGVDLASINYHFGSRGGLYEAVLIEAHRRFISMETLKELDSADLPAQEKLRKMIESLVEGSIGRQGWHSRVLGREIFFPSSHLPALQKNEILPKARVATSILSEITSIPVDDPALIRCAVSIGAPCVTLMAGARSISGKLLGASVETLVSHFYQFAIGGLEAVAREHSKTAQRAVLSTPPE